MPRKINKEDIINKINEVCKKYKYSFTNIDYKNSSSKIEVECIKHLYKWNCVLNNFINEKSKCILCKTEEKSEVNKKIFFEKIINKCISNNYSFLGIKDNKLFNVKEKLEIKCNIDNHIWNPTTDNFLSKDSNCPKCSGRYKEKEEYIKNILLVCDKTNKVIKNLDNFENTSSKLEVSCKKCNNSWKTNYSSFIRFKGCRKCLKLDKLSDIESIKAINKQCKIRNYTFLGFDNENNKIENAKSKIKIKCHKGHEFNLQYNNFIYSNQGCSICKESKGEVVIRSFLIENNIEYISQYRTKDCKYKKPLPFDFYIKEYNLMIEYDGKQHYEESIIRGHLLDLESIKYRDEIKNQYCLNNNIGLLRIRYDENILNRLNDYFFES